jgi:hypothetical protein
MPGLTGRFHGESDLVWRGAGPVVPAARHFAETEHPAGAAGGAPGEGGEAEDGHKDWRLPYLREAAQSRKYRQRAQNAEAEVAELKARALSPQQHAEYERLRAAGEEAAAKDERIAALEQVVRQLVGRDALTKALVACGVGSGLPNGEKMLAQAVSLLSPHVRVELSGDEPAATVVGGDGEPLLEGGEDGPPVSVCQFVTNWLTAEGAHFLPPSGDTGSGARRGSSPPAGASVDQLDADPRKKAEFIARHGPAAYVQLARRRKQAQGIT